MNPVRPEELWAYLDGELAAERAEAVREALGRDPSLRDEHQRLLNLDVAWRTAADRAAFRPSVTFPAPLRLSPRLVAAGVVALLVLRLGLKAVPTPLSLAIEAVVLGVVIGRLFWRLVDVSEQECRQLTRQAVR